MTKRQGSLGIYLLRSSDLADRTVPGLMRSRAPPVRSFIRPTEAGLRGVARELVPVGRGFREGRVDRRQNWSFAILARRA